MLKKQLFGVEIEMTGITRRRAAEVVAKVLNSTPSVPQYSFCYTQTIKDSFNRTWKIIPDSSIYPESKEERASEEHKIEFVTPPLNYNDIELLQTIVRELHKSGAFTNDSCGIHIHIDGANHTPDSLKRLVMFTISRQDLIYEALEIEGRGFNWCKKLNENILKEMKSCSQLTKDETERIWYSPANDGYEGGINYEHYNTTRYHGINLHSYFTKGTVEFRLFNSTLHDEKIKAYIQFCLAMSAWAIESNEKISFHSMEGYTPQQKITIMRNVLIRRLGLAGKEFKTCRLWLMTPLKKSAGMTCRAA